MVDPRGEDSLGPFPTDQPLEQQQSEAQPITEDDEEQEEMIRILLGPYVQHRRLCISDELTQSNTDDILQRSEEQLEEKTGAREEEWQGIVQEQIIEGGICQ